MILSNKPQCLSQKKQYIKVECDHCFEKRECKAMSISLRKKEKNKLAILEESLSLYLLRTSGS